MKNTIPQITVIMPVYNAALFLKAAISSICDQVYTDFELIIIDDGSTDDSYKVMSQFQDRRIKIVKHVRNKGLVYTLNEGISIARGEYIARMDADDIAEPNRFKVQISYLKNNPEVDILGSSIKVFGTDSYIWSLPTESKEIDAHTLFRCSMAHPSVIMRKKSLEKYKLRYSTEYPDAEDFFLWAKILSLGGKLANIGSPLLLYRTHETQIGHKNKKQIMSTREIYKWQLLHRLSIKASGGELELHHNISTLSRSKNINEIKEKRNWLIKLIKANNRRRIYDINIFRNLCAYYWTDNCYVSTIGFEKYIYMMLYPTTLKIIIKKLRARFL